MPHKCTYGGLHISLQLKLHQISQNKHLHEDNSQIKDLFLSGKPSSSLPTILHSVRKPFPQPSIAVTKTDYHILPWKRNTRVKSSCPLSIQKRHYRNLRGPTTAHIPPFCCLLGDGKHSSLAVLREPAAVARTQLSR